MKTQFVIIFMLLANIVCGQHKYLDIKEVSLTDTFLIKSIGDLYEKMNKKYEHFSQGLGYIKVHETNIGCDSISRQYWLDPDLTSVKSYNAPRYYAFVHERPVLIYIESFTELIDFQYSPKSLKMLNKMLSRYLLPTQKIKGRDESGKVVVNDKNFRKEYFYKGEGIFLNYDGENSISVHPVTEY